MRHRDLLILGALAVGAYLIWSRNQAPAGGSPWYVVVPGSPDPSNPGGWVAPTIQSTCTANPSADTLCSNTDYYGASVPGYDVCGTVAGQVC